MQCGLSTLINSYHCSSVSNVLTIYTVDPNIVSIHPSVHSFVRPSVHPTIHMSIHPSIHTQHILHTYMHTCIQTYRHTDIQTYRLTDIHVGLHTYKHRKSR